MIAAPKDFTAKTVKPGDVLIFRIDDTDAEYRDYVEALMDVAADMVEKTGAAGAIVLSEKCELETVTVAELQRIIDNA